MKKFDLDNTLVSELNSVEIVDLKEYLMFCKLRIRAKFFLQIMDNEYKLQDDFSKSEKFLSDEIFDYVRNLVIENGLMEVDHISQNEWQELEKKDLVYQRKIRREKLIQLNNIIS